MKHGKIASSIFAVATLGLLAGSLAPVTAVAMEPRVDQEEHLQPTGKGRGEKDPTGETHRNARLFGGATTNGINYHGGPVMLGTVNIYYIWYGNWTNNSATTILQTFASAIGATPYFNINTTYYNSANARVSGKVAFGKFINVTSYPAGAASYATSLGDSDIKTIVSNAISAGSLPLDSNGVYFVLTSADVKETSGFCTQYCGWHTHASIRNVDIKYSFIGNPDQCPNACAAQSTSPNGNAGADGMASIIAHELSETVSDPDLNAWFDRSGYENADKCAWTFGATKTAPNGSHYNVTFGSLNWLLQQNWVNASGGSCKLAYP
jgi:hypothetical protein